MVVWSGQSFFSAAGGPGILLFGTRTEEDGIWQSNSAIPIEGPGGKGTRVESTITITVTSVMSIRRSVSQGSCVDFKAIVAPRASPYVREWRTRREKVTCIFKL